MIDNRIVERIKQFRKNYPIFSEVADPTIFTASCIKDFFFEKTDNPFDPYIIKDWLTDKTHDGGIDAVFNDPNSNNNDVIIVQSKYYTKGALAKNEILSELAKLNVTIRDLKKKNYALYNDDVVRQFAIAWSQKEDEASIKVYFFASFNIMKATKEEIINTICSQNYDFDVEFVFGKDIVKQIEFCNKDKQTIDFETLIIEGADNYLSYQDSVVLNLSAKSLKEAYAKYEKNILGLNLRYHLSSGKNVDKAISDTIEKCPGKFWFLNNGIVIVCENYKIEGKKLLLWNFSIVNGGQTTFQIAKTNFNGDFFLQCKIVKAIGNYAIDQNTFINEIAVATNSQKQIRNYDIESNNSSHQKLKIELSKYGIFYKTKRGEKVPSGGPIHYHYVTRIEELGKIGLACILQKPGLARTHPGKMLDEGYNKRIFSKSIPTGIYADGVMISKYYLEYIKKLDFNSYSQNETTAFKIGLTYQLAVFMLEAKIKKDIISDGDIRVRKEDFKRKIEDIGHMERILKTNINVEDIEYLFDKIHYVFMLCFNNAFYSNSSLSIIDYFKDDSYYYTEILPRFLHEKSHDKKFQEIMSKLV